MFLTQTLSISQAQYCTSLAFAPPITIKSVTLIVFLTLESCQSLLSLFAGNVCFLWIYFLLVNYDPISQHVSVLWQHPLSLPSTRHNLIAPLTRININISHFQISILYRFIVEPVDMSQCHNSWPRRTCHTDCNVVTPVMCDAGVTAWQSLSHLWTPRKCLFNIENNRIKSAGSVQH